MDADLDLRRLRAFLCLVEEGGFTAAAQKMGVTQSAVSHAIRSLQEDLGCRLLYRAGRKTHLTRQGEALKQRLDKLFYEFDQIRPALGALDDLDRGALRIGCTESASQHVLPGVLREFKECFPLYTVSVHPGDTPTLRRSLGNRQVDVVVGLLPGKDPMITAHSIFHDELAYLIGATHPWNALKRPSPRHLAGETFIVYPRGSLTYSLVEEGFLKSGVRMNSVIELGNTEAAKELVKLGVGVGIMAEWVARHEIAAGTILARQLVPRIRRNWAVFWLKTRPLNLAEQTFVGLCESVGAAFADELRN